MIALHDEFHFDQDVTDRKNGRFDAFRDDWANVVYANPPYGPEIGRWLARAWFMIGAGLTSVAVFLLPARTDTRWFHEWVYGIAEIRFLRGRIRFKGASASAPFPSMVVILR